MKGGPLTPLDLPYIDGKIWRPESDFAWRFRDGTILWIKKGFESDLNSIPRLLRVLLSPVEYGEAGLIHDWLYFNRGQVTVWMDPSWGMPPPGARPVRPDLGPGLLSNDRFMTAILGMAALEITWSREECDRRYCEILWDTGAPMWKAEAQHLGVRLGGWYQWWKHGLAKKKREAALAAAV